jgi:hypothetical protein
MESKKNYLVRADPGAGGASGEVVAFALFRVVIKSHCVETESGN